ncbi:MAG: AraC family transcriptional regulator [Bacteroidales bacterium]
MILLSLSIIGFILSIILLYHNARKFPASIYLGALFFLVSLYGFIQWVFYYSDSPALVGIFYSNFAFLAFLIGPLNYWYIRSILKDDYRLKKRDRWHLAPALIAMVTSIPYMFTSWAEKTRVASEIINDLNYLMIIEPTVIHQLMPNEFIYLGRDVLIFIYLIFSVLLLVRYFRQAKEQSVIFRQQYMVKWLMVFQFFYLLLVTGHVLVMTHAIVLDDPNLVYAASRVQLIASIGLTGLLISPFFFPEILYGLPRIPGHYRKRGNHGKSQALHVPKKNIVSLESEYVRLIGEKVEQCMTDHKPYLQKEFNLTELSVLIHVPVHHLAYYFREERNQSFINYRNKWRVEHAKTMMNDGKAKELTLEAIGMLSGFASRNSFIIAFKRCEGLTPHEYSSKAETGAY